MPLKKAIQVLQTCEAELRQILGEAASAGDYEAVQRIVRLAERIASLVSSAEVTGAPCQDNRLAGSDQPDRPDALSLVREPAYPKSAGGARRRRKKGRRSGAKRKGSYPKFARHQDYLIKIGWSRKDKKEYQHKAPRVVAELLADRVAERSPHAELVATDTLFPLVEPDGTEVPTYQAYMCLAWFRKLGIVVQDGRKGYHAPNASEIRAIFLNSWDELPTVKALRAS